MEANEEKRSKKYILPLIVIIILIIILGVLLLFIKNRISLLPKAENYNNSASVSFSNSYIFASPVRAKAGHQTIPGENIRITVFLLDDKGLGIFDKKVTLGNLDGPINIVDVQSLTDETGKAIFDINSNSKGAFFIEAAVGGSRLPQRVKVVFD
ncbi:MAG: hypothetical protein Q8L01_03740 [Candidatus Woesebacteria bacterium]|nr:hypothetical protein [Candidatus Woesebacteria bacterium]